jgi:hypothetical protein
MTTAYQEVKAVLDAAKERRDWIMSSTIRVIEHGWECEWIEHSLILPLERALASLPGERVEIQVLRGNVASGHRVFRAMSDEPLWMCDNCGFQANTEEDAHLHGASLR